jgi:hypothetical protein
MRSQEASFGGWHRVASLIPDLWAPGEGGGLAAQIAVGSVGHPGRVGMEIDERRSAAELFQESFLPVLLGG